MDWKILKQKKGYFVNILNNVESVIDRYREDYGISTNI